VPVPVYFKFGEREANVTQDEAREFAADLDPASPLHSQILARVDGNVTSPIDMDFLADEDLVALSRAIRSREERGDEVAPGPRLLGQRLAVAIGARGRLE
jgi:hypothetical protein